MSIFFPPYLSHDLIKQHGKTHKDSQDWLNQGSGDLYNIRRYGTNKETKIIPDSSCASDLRLKWESYAEKDTTSAIAAIFNGTLYYPTWNGYIKAVKVLDGSLIWKKSLKELTGLNTSTHHDFVVDWIVSRTTPTIACDLLLVGIYGPAMVIAVKRSTGELVWSTQLSSNVAGVITMSGTYFQGLVIIVNFFFLFFRRDHNLIKIGYNVTSIDIYALNQPI